MHFFTFIYFRLFIFFVHSCFLGEKSYFSKEKASDESGKFFANYRNFVALLCKIQLGETKPESIHS